MKKVLKTIACVASVSHRVIARKFFFCSRPSFLDEPREETLATQAMKTRKKSFKPSNWPDLTIQQSWPRTSTALYNSALSRLTPKWKQNRSVIHLFCRHSFVVAVTVTFGYRRTSRKRPPKMRTLSDRLREVVAHKNQTTGSLFQEEVPCTSTSWNIIYCMQFLSYAMSISVLSWLKFYVYSK